MTSQGVPYPRRRPIDWQFIHRVRAARKEAATYKARGFRQHETDWEIIRGGRYNEVIVEVEIASDGKSVWTKLGPPS